MGGGWARVVAILLALAPLALGGLVPEALAAPQIPLGPLVAALLTVAALALVVILFSVAEAVPVPVIVFVVGVAVSLLLVVVVIISLLVVMISASPTSTMPVTVLRDLPDIDVVIARMRTGFETCIISGKITNPKVSPFMRVA